jgi:hypothetical protein
MKNNLLGRILLPGDKASRLLQEAPHSKSIFEQLWPRLASHLSGLAAARCTGARHSDRRSGVVQDFLSSQT